MERKRERKEAEKMEISNATVFSQYAAVDNAKNKSFSFVFCVFLFSQFLCFYQIILERFLQQQQI